MVTDPFQPTKIDTGGPGIKNMNRYRMIYHDQLTCAKQISGALLLPGAIPTYGTKRPQVP